MSHRSFTLVLAGGRARGYAHVRVLRELEHMGLTPAGIVGVSMGAVVAPATPAVVVSPSKIHGSHEVDVKRG